MTAYNVNVNENEDTAVKPPAPRPVKSEPEAFATFWNCYPRKVAKPVALKAWMKINPDEAIQKAIIYGLSRAKLSEQWQRDGGQYIPHPATWLNQRRWEDQQPEPMDSGSGTYSVYRRFGDED